MKRYLCSKLKLKQMAQFIFEGDYRNTAGFVKVRLLLFSFKDENKVNIIYSPHLDLSGYGKTIIDAKESFNIAFEDFIDYTFKKKTLSKVMSRLGWQVKGSSAKPKKMVAPSITSIISENEYISEIFDKYPVRTFHQEVGLPALV
jgi:hypothetical protein